MKVKGSCKNFPLWKKNTHLLRFSNLNKSPAKTLKFPQPPIKLFTYQGVYIKLNTFKLQKRKKKWPIVTRKKTPSLTSQNHLPNKQKKFESVFDSPPKLSTFHSKVVIPPSSERHTHLKWLPLSAKRRRRLSTLTLHKTHLPPEIYFIFEHLPEHLLLIRSWGGEYLAFSITFFFAFGIPFFAFSITFFALRCIKRNLLSLVSCDRSFF